VPERGETPEAEGEEMKSEQELRRYRDGLRKAMMTPCGCHGTEHAMQCAIGGEQMKANLMLVAWVLGEAPEHDEFASMLYDLAGK
jgi:hypothetical protein